MAMAAAYDGVGEPGEGVGAEKSRRRRRLRLRLERRRVAVGEGRVPVSELVAGDGDVGAMRRCWEGWWREGSHGRGGDRKTRVIASSLLCFKEVLSCAFRPGN